MNSKKLIIFFISCFIIVSVGVFSYPSTSYSDNVKIITSDLNKPYKILGLVSFRSGFPVFEKVNDQLRKQAEDMGADYIIETRYLVGTDSGYFFGYGTAVKIIEDK
jgi:hypothetical protein